MTMHRFSHSTALVALSLTALSMAVLAGLFAGPAHAAFPTAVNSQITDIVESAHNAGELLPPDHGWDGASRRFMLDDDHPWVTPAEVTNLTDSPSYDETVAWLQRLVEAVPQLHLESLGKSPEGRDIWMVIASTDGSTPEALKASGKPLLLAHSGIHSGEIDGKDAGLMLLRDMTVAGRHTGLLDHVNLLFIPILSVDGHERSSTFSRINQRGPVTMGWRSNARNQNLNRDFSKLDTPEVRALIGAFRRWQPDLYIDLHVTDGADYQYDITWGYTGQHGYSPNIARWLDDVLSPALHRDLEAQGHIPGPLIFLVDKRRPEQGNYGWTASPRFSNGYGDAAQLASVLVENHSLKPYDQRVLGTYVLLVSALETLGSHGEGLRRATAEDRARRADPVPLTWTTPSDTAPETFTFKGIEFRLERSAVSGGLRQVWTGTPAEWQIPLVESSQPLLKASRPAAYWLPPAWGDVIERLRLHGLAVETIDEATEVEVEMYRLVDPLLDSMPFEGHPRVSATPVAERRRVTFPAGSVRVPTDQPLGTLAVLLLEPASPDSFFQWGFFLEVLQRTEYFENYVMEPLAELMLRESPELAAEFEAKLLDDPDFAGDPSARLLWFYERTPFSDVRYQLYPVGRELSTP